jgi:hypothetical protein
MFLQAVPVILANALERGQRHVLVHLRLGVSFYGSGFRHKPRI